MTKSKKRFHTPEEKVAILKKYFVEGVPLSDICDQYGLHPLGYLRRHFQIGVAEATELLSERNPEESCLAASDT